MLDMYYSRHGLKVMAQSTILSACQRYDNFRRKIDANQLEGQALTFALELKQHLIAPISPASIQNAIKFAHESVKQEVDKLEVALTREFFECTDDFTLGPTVNPGSTEYHFAGIGDVVMVLDTSIYAVGDDMYQQQIAAALALQLDIWTMGTSDDRRFDAPTYIEGGDTFEVAEGRDGRQIFVSNENDVLNKAEYACRIVRTPLIPTGGDIDPGVALTNVLARMATRRYEQMKSSTTFGKSQVVILISFGRISTSDRQDFKNAVWRMRSRTPESKLIIVTRHAPISDFVEFVDDPKQDIITLQLLNEERRAILDARRIYDRISKIPGQVTFELCAGPNYKEWESELTLQLIPNTQRSLILHPRQFWSSQDLKINFNVRFNSANICWSRQNYDDYIGSKNTKYDEQCKSVSVTKGSSVSRKATFSWIDPCDGKPPDFCLPIYFRIEAVDSGGLNCFSDNFPCRVANAVEVTMTHQGMSCGAWRINAKELLLTWTTVFFVASLLH